MRWESQEGLLEVRQRRQDWEEGKGTLGAGSVTCRPTQVSSGALDDGEPRGSDFMPPAQKVHTPLRFSLQQSHP